MAGLRILAVAALAVAVPLSAFANNPAADAVKPCLDYWHKGDSSPCAPPPSPTVPKPVAQASPTTPTIAAPAAADNSSSLDARIDKFLEAYGKPPREFVAFYLEPTPENAMKWVHSYQGLLDRSQQLAYVWTQAETLYAQALKQGIPAATYASTTLAPVRDFGVPVPGFGSPFAGTQYQGASGLMPIPAALAAGATSTPSVVAANLSGLSGFNAAVSGIPGAPTLAGDPTSMHQPRSGGLSGLNISASAPLAPYDGPLLVTYYFSATCPYCHKFTPELAKLQEELGSGLLRLTCVDLTPYGGPGIGPKEENIMSDLTCNWRPPESGEEERFGIRQTPTLTVQRRPDGPYERVSGYVEFDKLRGYLLGLTEGK